LEEGAGPAGEPVWRFTVRQAVNEAARHSFINLAAVCAFLESELAGSLPACHPDDSSAP
jgi:hypothetical protein